MRAMSGSKSIDPALSSMICCLGVSLIVSVCSGATIVTNELGSSFPFAKDSGVRTRLYFNGTELQVIRSDGNGTPTIFSSSTAEDEEQVMYLSRVMCRGHGKLVKGLCDCEHDIERGFYAGAHCQDCESGYSRNFATGLCTELIQQ